MTLVLAVSGVASAATPDARIKAAAEAAQPAVIESLQKMVQIESGSQDLAGLAAMANFTELRLQALGFKTERRKVTASAGADMVIGTLQGTGRRRLMLQAHLDTVYQKGILGSQPYRVEGGRIYGPGIADDKGGIAVILHSLALLRDAGWKNYDTLTVLFNPDEEVGSPGSGETIAALADQHDVVLSCEPTAAKAVAGREGLLLGASGATSARMEVKGRTSHAGAAPELGRNALVELAYQIVQTRDIANDVTGARLQWTTAQAGLVRNQIPDSAVATADVRTTQPGAAEKLQAKLQAAVDAHKLVPDTETRVTIAAGRPAFIANAAGRAMAERAQAIYAEIDRPLELVDMTGGGTDAAFAGRSGKAAVVESFGLAGFGYHARDEYIEVDSIVPRLYLMARLLVELGQD
jgi:glutamate carboxypeptidase